MKIPFWYSYKTALCSLGFNCLSCSMYVMMISSKVWLLFLYDYSCTIYIVKIEYIMIFKVRRYEYLHLISSRLTIFQFLVLFYIVICLYIHKIYIHLSNILLLYKCNYKESAIKLVCFLFVQIYEVRRYNVYGSKWCNKEWSKCWLWKA